MFQLTPAQTATLKDWFIPDQPGPLVGLHVLNTGNGTCHVDRWPKPRAILVNTAGNYALAGEPTALEPDELKPWITGFVEAPQRFLPLLEAAFPELITWDRVILELQGRPTFSRPSEPLLRRLGPGDAHHLQGLSSASNWIGKTWGGPEGLAASGLAWGAFVEGSHPELVEGRLASVACAFFVGDRYEEIGVVTEPEFRGRGLSVACSGALCLDIQGRGHTSSWTTSPDNTASLRVAEKLGFIKHRHDYLYVIGHAPPAPPRQTKDE